MSNVAARIRLLRKFWQIAKWCQHPAHLIPLATIPATFLIAYLGFVVGNNRMPDPFFSIWDRWDTTHYLEIATHGYTTGPKADLICFFPLYPLVIRIFSFVFPSLFAALLIANVSFVFAAHYLFKLVRLDHKEDTATRAVFYFCIFPSAYFFHAGYSESLFLALVLSSFYFARTKRWWLACVLGMFVGSSRMPGLAMLPALLVEYGAQKKWNLRKIVSPELAAFAIVPLGLAAYLLLNYALFGNPMQFTVFQKQNYSKSIVFPWQGVSRSLAQISVSGAYHKFYIGYFEFFAGLTGLSISVWAFLKGRKSYAIFSLISALILCSQSFWLSNPRYLLGIFPIFFFLGELSKRPFVHAFLAFTSSGLYALGLVRFVSGSWAL